MSIAVETTPTLLSNKDKEIQAISEEDHTKVMQRVTKMVNDSDAQQLAAKYKMNITSVTWEDTGRSKNSSWGPNISDMTLAVESSRMPIIRSPNYVDETCDVPMEKIPIKVGNQAGVELDTVSLREYLKYFRDYLHDPADWKGSNNSLFAERDTHVILSSQACFLPVPKSGEAKFNVALYNYQSSAASPAVLAIVATSKGTSAQIVTNGGRSGQLLYFNQNGQKCSFVGVRVSDERKNNGESEEQQSKKELTEEEKQDNVIMIIQVPLKHNAPVRKGFVKKDMKEKNTNYKKKERRSESKDKERVDVEDAIVKLGESEGKFTEIGGLAIERDPQFPVRVTLQFYKCTSNGLVDAEVIGGIAKQISDSQKEGEYFGSLVVEKTNRPTEHTFNTHAPENPKSPIVLAPTPSTSNSSEVRPPWWNDLSSKLKKTFSKN